MKYLAYLALIGASAASEDKINFSYMKKKEVANTKDLGILDKVSNWFSGDAAESMYQVDSSKPKRSLQ
jgi:hypothetical protein